MRLTDAVFARMVVMLHKCIIFAIDSTYIAKFSNNLTIWANL